MIEHSDWETLLLDVLIKKPGCVIAGVIGGLRDRSPHGRGYALQPTARACWIAGLSLWVALIGGVWLLVALVV